ncbi:hypothetical protein [Parasitella parasitica]|uniref:Uncharacterized protein n=1 Tax=Parasitella parasitica TaxID=35722 RepID=A0A0B7NBI8_9FUNG|nr:hypothetical protein [Parasitella parasitica]
MNNAIYKLKHDADPSTKNKQRKAFIDLKKPCHHKMEECEIDQEVDESKLVSSGTDNGVVNVTETVAFGVDRLKYHLRLYNHFQVLQDENGTFMEENKDAQFQELPRSFKIRSAEIPQQSGLARLTILGQQVANYEADLSQSIGIQHCSTFGKLETAFDQYSQAKTSVRKFYHSKSNAKKKRRYELAKGKYYDRLAAKERRFTHASTPIMFIGDRGHAVVSPFKGHLRFGGHWKELCHSRYTPTLITNEHNSSQTCLWCFSKLSHPYTALDGQVKMTNGSFICLNAACPQKYVVMSRDRLSALAIGLAGAAQLMLGYTFPCFDPKNTTEKQAMFSHLALVFSNRKQQTSSPSVGG